MPMPRTRGLENLCFMSALLSFNSQTVELTCLKFRRLWYVQSQAATPLIPDIRRCHPPRSPHPGVFESAFCVELLVADTALEQ